MQVHRGTQRPIKKLLNEEVITMRVSKNTCSFRIVIQAVPFGKISVDCRLSRYVALFDNTGTRNFRLNIKQKYRLYFRKINKLETAIAKQ